MAKLFRLVVKFRGDRVTVTSLRRAAHGRYALHSQSHLARADLAASMADPEFQKKNLLRAKVIR